MNLLRKEMNGEWNIRQSNLYNVIRRFIWLSFSRMDIRRCILNLHEVGEGEMIDCDPYWCQWITSTMVNQGYVYEMTKKIYEVRW